MKKEKQKDRKNRLDDKLSSASGEKKKRQTYFLVQLKVQS